MAKSKLKSKSFWLSAATRAIRTFAQTAIATIGVASVMSDVDWVTVLSSSLLATILSFLTSIVAGLPEVSE